MSQPPHVDWNIKWDLVTLTVSQVSSDYTCLSPTVLPHSKTCICCINTPESVLRVEDPVTIDYRLFLPFFLKVCYELLLLRKQKVQSPPISFFRFYNELIGVNSIISWVDKVRSSNRDLTLLLPRIHKGWCILHLLV